MSSMMTYNDFIDFEFRYGGEVVTNYSKIREDLFGSDTGTRIIKGSGNYPISDFNFIKAVWRLAIARSDEWESTGGMNLIVDGQFYREPVNNVFLKGIVYLETDISDKFYVTFVNLYEQEEDL